MSGIRLARPYAKGMAERGWDRVQFVSRVRLEISVEMVHYGMTKTAQLAVSRGLAETLAGTGVTVNAILPGPTRSERVSEFIGKIASDRGLPAAQVEQEFIATERSGSLIKRLATVDEVANLAVYLASEQACATAGAAKRVDGGMVRSVVRGGPRRAGRAVGEGYASRYCFSPAPAGGFTLATYASRRRLVLPRVTVELRHAACTPASVR